MKTKGVVWLPLLIIIATVAVVGIVTYGVVQTKNENKFGNANTANTAVVNRSNANSVANRNVNGGANVNSAANTNSAVPAGWKTYTNTTYGFSFQYPADETVNELSEQGFPTIQLLNGGVVFYRLRITATTNPVESNIVSNPECYREVESAMEAGDWKKYDFSCGMSGTQTRYSLTRGTAVYKFSLPGGVPGTLEQILETFRFTNTTADWKTYSNESGYTIQYPPSWSVSTALAPKTIQIVPPSAGGSIELAPVLFITTADEIETDLVQNTRTVLMNGVQTIRQTENGLAAFSATYFPQFQGHFKIYWPETYEDEYPEFERILSTFKVTE